MATIEQPEIRRIVVAPIDDIEIRDSKAGKGQITVAGHAAVFNRLSHDLGGFREKIAPGAFDDVLNSVPPPDVHFVWDHDTRFTLARTLNKTLELRVDPVGLHFWARVAPTSYAADLRILLERGDIDQASFAFIVGEDEWEVDKDDNVTRTILSIEQLFDVTVTAMGAFPQTDVSLRSLFDAALAAGRIPQLVAEPEEIVAAPQDEVADNSTTPPREETWHEVDYVEFSAGEEQRADAPEEAVELSVERARNRDDLTNLKRETRAAVQEAKRQQLESERHHK